MSGALGGTRARIPRGDLTSPWRWLLVVGTMSPVLVLTLTPGAEDSVASRFLVCLICGEFGGANLVRNVVLFVPLGVSLAILLSPGHWAFLAVLGLTSAIETLQFHIPGRNPMVADVAANFIGGSVGVLVVRWAGAWVRTSRVRAAWFSLASAITASSVFLVTAWLYGVDLPRSEYWGQWTPRLGHLDHYEGRVLAASVGGLPTPSGRLADSDAVRVQLWSSKSLEVEALVGRPPAALAPIFSIHDGQRREILLLGALREDLVGRVRYRAHRFRFDRPDLRIPAAFQEVAVGDTVYLEFRPAGGNACLGLNDREVCGVGPRLERGWALLRYVAAAPEWIRRTLDFGWMFALLLPFGFFVRRHTLSMLGGLLLVPMVGGGWWMSSVASPSWWGLLGATVGLSLGIFVAWLVRRPGATDVVVTQHTSPRDHS